MRKKYNLCGVTNSLELYLTEGRDEGLCVKMFCYVPGGYTKMCEQERRIICIPFMAVIVSC